MATKTKKKPPAKTTTSSKGNTKGPTAQQQGKIVKGAGAGTSSASKKKKKAKKKKKGDPINVVTGSVIELVTDLEVDGPIPFDWARSYSSDRASSFGPLGRGWTHSFHEWLEIQGDRAFFHDEEGDTIELVVPPPRGTSFHRGAQIELRHHEGDRFELFDLDDRWTRELSPVTPGGPPMLRSIRDAWGNAVTLAYEDGHLARITDAVGRQIRVLPDPTSKGRVKRVELWADDKLFEWFDYAYTEEGDLASATNALGHAHRYEYDGKHRIVRKTLKNGFRVHYEYDEDHGRCVRTFGDGGYHSVELTYDLDKKTTTTHGEPQPRVFEWDDRGAVLREATFDGRFVEVNEYDDDLLLLSTTNAAGEAHAYEYDDRGHLVRHTDPAGNETKYEIHDDLLVRIVYPDGLEKRFVHDGQGEVQAVTFPTGETITLARDGRGNVTGTYGPDGVIETCVYDDRQELVRATDARGLVTTYTYDALGQPVARTDNLGRTTRIEYDAIGQIVAVTYPDGQRTVHEYEPNGELARVVRPGGEIRLSYVASGVLSEATFEDGQTWRFTYDREEKPRAVVNPRGERYEYRYDAAGRVIEERTFDGRTLKYRYDLGGRIARVEHADETWRAFEYDPLGFVAVETSSHGTITFERDSLGEIKKATFDEGPYKSEVVFEHDKLGRIVSETQDGETVRYEHDARGEIAARVLPGDVVTRYYYDVAGELSAVDHRGHKLLLQRDQAGREIRKHVYGSSVDILSRYDASDRLVERTATRPSREGQQAHDLLSRRLWTYDALGRVTDVSDRRFGATHYRYDDRSRLVEARRGSKLEAFEYDPAGSIVSILTEAGATPRPFSVARGNRLVRTGDAELENDLGGRRVKKTALAGGEPIGDVTEYVWDCRDQLREVTLPSGERVRYFYDAFGRRTRKEIHPAPPAPGDLPAKPPEPRVVTYLWDGDCLAREIDSDRGQRVFVHDEDELQPLLQDEQGEVFTYVNDHLGVAKELVDPQGRIVWAAAHSAFNTVVETWRDPDARRPRPVESPFRGPGQYADEETGLFYNRFRYFDPSVGRFLSPDPLGLPGGANLFALDGSPTFTADPFGLAGVNDPGYIVYGIYQGNSSTPFYVGITNQGIPARRAQHRKTGRMNNSRRMEQLPGTGTMTHAEARGHEQFNIEKYGTRKGKYGNRQASFNKSRKDYRGRRFKAEYNKLKKAAAAKAAKAAKAKKSKGSK